MNCQTRPFSIPDSKNRKIVATWAIDYLISVVLLYVKVGGTTGPIISYRVKSALSRLSTLSRKITISLSSTVCKNGVIISGGSAVPSYNISPIFTLAYFTPGTQVKVEPVVDESSGLR